MDDGCKKKEKQEEKLKNGSQKKNEKREMEVLEQNRMFRVGSHSIYFCLA